MDLRRIVDTLEKIIMIPGYALLGETHGRIVFLSSLEGEVNLWSMDPEGRDLRRLTSEPIVDAEKPDPRSPYVVFSRDVARGRELHRLFIVDARGDGERLLAETPLMRILSFVYRAGEAVFVGVSREGLGLYRIGSDGGWEKLVDLGSILFVTDFNDGYIVGFGPLKGDPRSMELYIYDRGSGDARIYTPKDGSMNKYPVLVGDQVLFESSFTGENKLYIYDPGAGELSEVSFTHRDYYDYRPVEHSLYGVLGDGRIWVIGKRNGRMKLFIDGRAVETPDGTIHGYPVFHGSSVYVAVSNMVSPTRILRIDLETGKSKVIVDNRLPEDIRESLGGREFVTYRSFDGLEIPMYIVYSGKTSRPGPTVVYVHGGPWSEVMDVWDKMIASIVACGYHVLAPNYRGSTGYGDWFRTLDIGDPGGGDLEDIVYAVKYGLEKGVAEKDRVAIMGYSYGGYMSYLALGRYPELWRCGVAGAGVVDWGEMYSLGDAAFRQFIDILFAGRKELWRERSPITYIENVKAPLCIVHPQNDTRTPLKPVLRYMDKLLELGRVFEAHIVPDMGHVIVRVDDAVKILLPALIFLEKYLKQ